MTRSIPAALLLSLVWAGTAAAADINELVAECEGCHGPGGVSTDPDVPSLAGQSETYIREVLDQFYNYERHCNTTTYRYGDKAKIPLSMCSVANSLSEADKKAVAEYFAGQ